MAGNKKPKRKGGARRDFVTRQAAATADRLRTKAKQQARIDRINHLPMGHPLNAPSIDKTFRPIERLLDEHEATGTIMADQDGNPLIRDEDGQEWIPLVPAMLHMTHLFDVVARCQTWISQPPGLRAYTMALEHNLPLTPQHFADARATIIWMRELIATVTRARWTELFFWACEQDALAEERAHQADEVDERAAA